MGGDQQVRRLGSQLRILLVEDEKLEVLGAVKGKVEGLGASITWLEDNLVVG